MPILGLMSPLISQGPRLLYFQCGWSDSTLSLGIVTVVVGVSWVGVIGSPIADLEKEEAASVVRGKLGLP